MGIRVGGRLSHCVYSTVWGSGGVTRDAISVLMRIFTHRRISNTIPNVSLLAEFLLLIVGDGDAGMAGISWYVEVAKFPFTYFFYSFLSFSRTTEQVPFALIIPPHEVGAIV